jgi:hypothetical protein
MQEGKEERRREGEGGRGTPLKIRKTGRPEDSVKIQDDSVKKPPPKN